MFPSQAGIELAEAVCEAVPCAEQVRFCSEGSVANELAASCPDKSGWGTLLVMCWHNIPGPRLIEVRDSTCVDVDILDCVNSYKQRILWIVRSI